MSQYGAYEMARTGSTASDILRYYYPGATVSTANNPWTSIDVQVLGRTSDPTTTSTWSGRAPTTGPGPPAR
ncbi:hypothetical protein ACQEVI_02625 [Promicromonospora sp. CA-289599]|uniref:hypothetical protein n=1 Tax=Promicromonospora sp. CA-289599 TaxID=3240014 RepID=UPI003D8C2ED5